MEQSGRLSVVPDSMSTRHVIAPLSVTIDATFLRSALLRTPSLLR